MLDYLQQFNKLKPEIKNKISAPQVMQKLAQIEERYDLDLAIVVMRVVIKELKLSDLSQFFIDNFNLSLNPAKHLQKELEREVFAEIMDYLKTEEPIQDLPIDKTKNLDRDKPETPRPDFSDSLDFDFKIGSAFIPTVNIEEIVKKAKLDLLDEFLLERLKNILNTYLKGIRSRVNTKETLSKSINTGGLNLSEIESDRVLKLADLQVSSSQKELLASKLTGQEMGRFVQARSGSKPQTDQESKGVKEKTAIALGLGASIAPDYDLKAALKSGETKRISSGQKAALASGQKTALETKKSDLALTAKSVSEEKPATSEKPVSEKPSSAPRPTAPASPSRVVPPTKTSRSFFRRPEQTPTTPKQTPPVKATSQTTPQANKAPASPIPTPATPSPSSTSPSPSKLAQRREAPSRSGRVQVKDVKAVPRIMGPIEELLYLDVVNFRRLGSTPQEITKKIFNKIKLLEKNGYDKMIAGIKAWKRSPVNLLYLKIFKEAMNSNLSVAQVIAIYQNQNQAYLTKEELDAIINLNSRLVF